MTSEPEKLLPVIQADIDAAIDLKYALDDAGSTSWSARSADPAKHPVAQAFAKHRLSSPVSGTDMVKREALTDDEALDASADSVGSSAVYGRAEAWAEGKTLTILFKDTGQLAKFRYVGLRSAPSAADLRGEPA